MKTYSAFVTLICLTLLASMLLMTKWKLPYTMNMTIYSHGLCYKYEYTKIEHTPKWEKLEYRWEHYTVPWVWFLGTWTGGWPDYKNYAWVWEEYKHQMVIDTGVCLYYSFWGSDIDSTFISLYDHPEAIDMLNGVVIKYKIFTPE